MAEKYFDSTGREISKEEYLNRQRGGEKVSKKTISGATPDDIKGVWQALKAMPEDTPEQIQAKADAIQAQYYQWNGFQYKDNAIMDGLAALKGEDVRLGTKLTEAKSKQKAEGAGEEYGKLKGEAEAKIEELGAIPETDLEKQLTALRQKRLAGEGVELTPDEVTRWYDIVGKIQAPLEQKATEELKQKYSDIGRYYGGGHSMQQRKLTEDILQQRYSNALNIATPQWAAKQSAIEAALGGLTQTTQETRRRAENPYQAWLGSIPGITGQQIASKYGYTIPSYNYTPPITPTYEYKESAWDKWLRETLQKGAESGIEKGVSLLLA